MESQGNNTNPNSVAVGGAQNTNAAPTLAELLVSEGALSQNTSGGPLFAAIPASPSKPTADARAVATDNKPDTQQDSVNTATKDAQQNNPAATQPNDQTATAAQQNPDVAPASGSEEDLNKALLQSLGLGAQATGAAESATKVDFSKLEKFTGGIKVETVDQLADILEKITQEAEALKASSLGVHNLQAAVINEFNEKKDLDGLNNYLQLKATNFSSMRDADLVDYYARFAIQQEEIRLGVKRTQEEVAASVKTAVDNFLSKDLVSRTSERSMIVEQLDKARNNYVTSIESPIAEKLKNITPAVVSKENQAELREFGTKLSGRISNATIPGYSLSAGAKAAVAGQFKDRSAEDVMKIIFGDELPEDKLLSAFMEYSPKVSSEVRQKYKSAISLSSALEAEKAKAELAANMQNIPKPGVNNVGTGGTPAVNSLAQEMLSSGVLKQNR